MKMRKARVVIFYDNKDITRDIGNHMVSFSYTDSSSKADDIKLELEDKKGLWRSDWFPQKGASVKADIITEDWEKQGNKKVLPCGKFEIDSIESSGPPDKVSINGVSVPITSNLRSQQKTKAWENITLSGIAGEIASYAGLKLIFDADDISYGRVDQVQISDLKFLNNLCQDAGITLKVTDTQIVIFNEAMYEAKGSVRKFTRGEDDVISYSFSTDSKDVYSEAEVSYNDPETGEQIEGSYKPENAPKTGQKLKINERCDSASNYASKAEKDAKAKELAKKKLREKNKAETTAKLVLVGDTLLAAGSNIELSGWGVFDGKYIIETATHSISSSGYTADLELRKVLEGY